jgi:TfoX/Sxy family transcriptional regulator of competence genes
MSQASLEQMQDEISAAAEAHNLDDELTFKPMFGGFCAYVNGRVFASLSDVGLALKLAPDAQAALLAKPDAKRLQYEPDAPESKQYIVVPDSIRNDKPTFADWVKQSAEWVLAQPAPKPKQKKSKPEK